LISANYSYINNNLSQYYGLGTGAGEFRKTSVTPGQRRGILTQGAVLAANSGTYETQPVLRGLYILEKVTCNEPPPPPAIDTTEADGIPGQTKKEKLAQHAKDPSCAGCHQFMDPLGFAFEKFDVVGAYREKYFGQDPVDSTGKLPSGETFKNHLDLIDILQDDKQVGHCMTDHVLTFSLGQEMKDTDHCRIEELTDSSINSGFTFRSIVENIVTSAAFKKKRGQE
jgi:hypothetical protein